MKNYLLLSKEVVNMKPNNSLWAWCIENNRLELLEEWDIEGNEGLTPKDITKSYSEKVFWICKSNYEHRWDSTVSNRVYNNSGCPHCKNNSTSYPEQYIYYVLKQKLEKVENRRVLGGYEYDISIKDRKNKIKLLVEYDGYYYHRVVNNNEKRERQKERYAKRIKYDFIRIREVLESEEVTMVGNVIEYKNRGNINQLNTIVEMLIDYINNTYGVNITKDIPEDAEQLAKENSAKEKYEKSIEVTHPKLVKLWDKENNGGLKPSHFTKGSGVEVYWKCSKGHSFKSKIIQMTSNISCPYCSGKKVLEGFNDLATTHPHLIEEWDFKKNIIKPTKISKGSTKDAWWICSKGHSYQTKVKNRGVFNSGCPYCSGKKVLEGFNDLKTTHPYLIEEWDFKKNVIKPTEISKGSNTEVWWKCKDNNEHIYQMSVNQKVNGGKCIVCREEKKNI